MTVKADIYIYIVKGGKKPKKVKLKNLKTGEESSVKIKDMVDEIKKFI